MNVEELNEIIKNFWYIEPTDQIVGCNESEILKIENMIGQVLPNNFKQLYLISNGGISNYDQVTYEDDEITLHGFATISDLSNSLKMTEVPSDVFVFAGESHSWFALDYRSSKIPSIIYYDEYDDCFLNISKDFDDFLSKVRE